MSQVDSLLAIENELNAAHFERRDMIRGMLNALLSRQHVVLLGPPGADKSGLSRDLCRRIHGRYFEWQLTRMSTPEELFGPISLKGLEQDSYRRVTTNKLPEATVAYVDETFKGSSSILNSMLSVLNERLFYNDGAPVQVPLEMAVGASNELPEDREELGALWDRFLLRFFVDYIHEDQAFEKLLRHAAPPATATVSLPQLHEAQAEVERVKLDDVIPQVVALRAKMRELAIPVSDRRWYDAMGVVQAEAYLCGRDTADPCDLKALVPVLWQEPSQFPQVRKTVFALVSPYDEAAEDLLDQAVEVYRESMGAPEDKQTAAGIEAAKAFKAILRRIDTTTKEALGDGKSAQALKDASTKVSKMYADVMQHCLKVTA